MLIRRDWCLVTKKYGHLVTTFILLNRIYNRIVIIIVSNIDIVLFNSADVLYSTDRDNYLLDVSHDGKVTWIFPGNKA